MQHLVGMAAHKLPDLVEHYLKYCRYRRMFEQTGTIDLSDESFLYPTTLLPLLILIERIGAENVIMPHNQDVAKYIRVVTRQDSIQEPKTYIPFTKLPKEHDEMEPILQRIRELGRDVEIIGYNLDAFILIVNEMVENIYEHSEFNMAYMCAQRYPTLAILDLCFADDGITIPGSFKKCGFRYDENEHYKAIHDALMGLSSKKESGRGTGLRSTGQIVQKGFNGEMFIASGFGAVYIAGGTHRMPFILSYDNRLDGTLISIRVPLRPQKINIYEFV